MTRICSMVLIASMMFVLITACGNDENINKTVIRSEPEIVAFDKYQLVNHADVIIEGTVVSQEVQEDFEGFPATDTVIKVTHVYKGNPGETVEVRAVGGETDDTVYIVEPELIPNFSKNEKVLVFLTIDKGTRPDRDDFGYYVVGQYQGKFSVTKNDTLENSAHSFSHANLQNEIDAIEASNKKNNLQKYYLDEGEESDI